MLSHYPLSFTLLFCAISIQHAIIPLNKTLKKSQALFQTFKAHVEQETLTHVAHTWRQKKEAIYRILWPRH